MSILSSSLWGLQASYNAISSGLSWGLSSVTEGTKSLLGHFVTPVNTPLIDSTEQRTDSIARTLKESPPSLLKKLVLRHLKTYPFKDSWNVCINGVYWGERKFDEEIIEEICNELKMEGFSVKEFQEEYRTYLKVIKPQKITDDRGDYLTCLCAAKEAFIQEESTHLLTSIQQKKPINEEKFVIGHRRYIPESVEVNKEALQCVIKQLEGDYDVTITPMPPPNPPPSVKSFLCLTRKT